MLRAPDDAAPAPPGAAAVAAVGPASQRDHRARPAGRALCVLGGARSAAPPGRVVRRRARGAWPRAQRPSTQPLGFLSVQRPHGAAPRAHPRVSPALVVWDSRVGGPAAAPASLGLVACPLGDTPAHGGLALFRADHPVALPTILPGGARAPCAAHRAAPGIHRHRGDHVVAHLVAGAGAAPGELLDAAALPLRARTSDVARRRAHHPGGRRAVPVLRGGAAGVGSHAAGRSAARRPIDVGGGDDLSVDHGNRGVVPMERPGRTR